MVRLELLAPARDYASAVAAVNHGADALYIGGHGFGARRAAANSVEDIARVVEYAHAFGVRVYATFNTVIFESEIERARQIAMELVSTGVDALIIQDMAVARMGLPVELHASTQMCNMTAEGVRFLEGVGFSRVVLERALSAEKIREIAEATSVEIEAFVHGAICVGHSGRCLLSRSMSSRSGNRGECSQPCRLTYDLCDEAGRKIISNKHLLSVKDLNLSARVGEMIDMGVTSFKIEGRLKEIGYTKNIVAHYRKLLDEAIAQREGYARSSCGVSQIEFEPNPQKSFARGESEYLFSGQRRGLADFDSPKSRGEFVGKVLRMNRSEAFTLEGCATLSAGDGVCFMTPEGLRGTNINRVEGEWIYPNRVEGIVRGGEIFRNFDKKFSDSVEASRTVRRIEVSANISISKSHITLTYIDCEGVSSSASAECSLDAAQNPEKMREVITSQLSKCGDTIFQVSQVDIEEGGEGYFIPSSQLSVLRREALASLLHMRINSMPRGGVHFRENIEAQYPIDTISAEESVTNPLATQFYVEHGAKSVAPSWELADSLSGARLMQSSYCIRGEIGECLKRGSKLRGELYLHRGAQRFLLKFDCRRCRMDVVNL